MPDSPGVIFDMDGVIVQSNPTHKEALRIFLDKYNLDVSEERLRNRLYGRTNKEWIPEIFEIEDPQKIEMLSDEKEQIFRNMFAPEEHTVEGIHYFLEHLQKENVPMAVATSAPRANADYVLSRLDIEHYFEAILDMSHVARGKPDPEVYLKASQALGKETENCIVVEDSLSGVKAGLDSGARVIGITTTHTREELASCHLVIDDFTGLEIDDLRCTLMPDGC